MVIGRTIYAFSRKGSHSATSEWPLASTRNSDADVELITNNVITAHIAISARHSFDSTRVCRSRPLGSGRGAAIVGSHLSACFTANPCSEPWRNVMRRKFFSELRGDEPFSLPGTVVETTGLFGSMGPLVFIKPYLFVSVSELDNNSARLLSFSGDETRRLITSPQRCQAAHCHSVS